MNLIPVEFRDDSALWAAASRAEFARRVGAGDLARGDSAAYGPGRKVRLGRADAARLRADVFSRESGGVETEHERELRRLYGNLGKPVSGPGPARVVRREVIDAVVRRQLAGLFQRTKPPAILSAATVAKYVRQ